MTKDSERVMPAPIKAAGKALLQTKDFHCMRRLSCQILRTAMMMVIIPQNSMRANLENAKRRRKRKSLRRIRKKRQRRRPKRTRRSTRSTSMMKWVMRFYLRIKMKKRRRWVMKMTSSQRQESSKRTVILMMKMRTRLKTMMSLWNDLINKIHIYLLKVISSTQG
jgi:hypothetical protein